ncbi:4Fe-4S dicluster domain-containing protein [Maledivibacter halophilus]|uniref:[FeFe] hydrogenase, group B1/B3 n=1 Tax=Maledivibacter halophilus TaxID=36842 RepID=A0A1T5JVP4_9FIRM|nr:4Fe-4S dicluster domain-containing protein [Maledivibacter halophilus]SKC55349.1 [FeFe] hydrogenase, group B1/B3 [Maledivibacter halophilus]
MRKFENDVQVIKYEVLKEVSKLAMEETLEEKYNTIPEKISPGPKPRTRCCVYKERAIIEERVKIARGGNKDNENNIEVLEIACDECSISRYTVTEACRGCLAKWCHEACPVGAIYYVDNKAYIDTNKCIECGKCKNVCPYNAISDVMRPCRKACEVNAISIDKDKKAVIDNEKCIQCGACVYKCPFGAIVDKSYVVDVINLLKESKQNDFNVYAAIAPAISSQFTHVNIRQLVNGIKLLGFHDVVEVALGADIVASHETEEFSKEIDKKGVITSSCCPAFVSYIEKNYPELKENISGSVSPMIAVSRLIKNIDKDAKVVFIGPCTAKKGEINREGIKGSTDYVITFEELTAMLDAAEIDLKKCNEDLLDNASFFGRIFARSGGLTEAIKHVIEEERIDTEFNPVVCDGLLECKKALNMAKVNRLKGNFIEGMACKGGCIGGAASVHHGPKDRNEVDKYGKLAIEKKIKDSIRVLNIDKLNLDR